MATTAPTTSPDIREALSKRILVLDGAMGTMIQRHKLTEEDYRSDRFKDWKQPVGGNSDLLVLTQPQIIQEIHEQYFEVGADIVETNTFTATTIAQEDYGMQDLAYEMNVQGARIARQAADKWTAKTPDKPRFVAGSIGPTNKTASLSPDVNDPGYRAITYQELVDAYKEQVNGLMDGGANLLLVETIFDTLNAKAALYAIQEVFDDRGAEIPIMVSGTITDASGRTLSGQTTEAFLISVSHVPLLSVGLNCALGADKLLPYMRTLGAKSPFHVSAHPNAGLPNEFGQYDETPEQMRAQIETFLEENLVNIIGGCCGTTPEHIKEIAAAAANFSPRLLPKSTAA